MKTRIGGLVAALAVAGCADGQPLGLPELTPIGTGLETARTTVPVTLPTEFPSQRGSLYGRNSRDLLTDVRANDVGDVLTVVIQIDENAEFENDTEREREGDSDFDFTIAGAGQGFDGPAGSANANGDFGVGSSSRFAGSGSIDRSEELNLAMAVVVTEVLPNGYLVISGSQEIRVNAEVRVLQLAGIVNPLDISRRNDVAYDKIAEARISYGGRGTVSTVQRPNWGQRLYDKVIPW